MSRPRLAAIAGTVALVAGFAAANTHLVTVSLASQPDCVAHSKGLEAGAADYRAAKPSC